MRLFIIILSLAFGLSACKDEASKFDEIGKFTAELNGEKMVFTSYFDKEANRSAIRVMSPAGVKMYLIDGSAGNVAGSAEFPFITATLQSGITGGGMHLEFIEIYDESYQKPLIANGKYGNRTMQNLVIGEDGSISFDFSADLVRINMEDENPIPGAAGAHIEGSFSGVIPTSELEE